MKIEWIILFHQSICLFEQAYFILFCFLSCLRFFAPASKSNRRPSPRMPAKKEISLTLTKPNQTSSHQNFQKKKNKLLINNINVSGFKPCEHYINISNLVSLRFCKLRINVVVNHIFGDRTGRHLKIDPDFHIARPRPRLMQDQDRQLK